MLRCKVIASLLQSKSGRFVQSKNVFRRGLRHEPIALAIFFPRDAGGSQQPPGRLSGGAIALLRGEARAVARYRAGA